MSFSFFSLKYGPDKLLTGFVQDSAS